MSWKRWLRTIRENPSEQHRPYVQSRRTRNRIVALANYFSLWTAYSGRGLRLYSSGSEVLHTHPVFSLTTISWGPHRHTLALRIDLVPTRSAAPAPGSCSWRSVLPWSSTPSGCAGSAATVALHPGNGRWPS